MFYTYLGPSASKDISGKVNIALCLIFQYSVLWDGKQVIYEIYLIQKFIIAKPCLSAPIKKFQHAFSKVTTEVISFRILLKLLLVE